MNIISGDFLAKAANYSYGNVNQVARKSERLFKENRSIERKTGSGSPSPNKIIAELLDNAREILEVWNVHHLIPLRDF